MTIFQFRNNAGRTVGDEGLSSRQEFLVARGREIFDSAKGVRDMIEERWYESQLRYDSKFNDKQRKWSEFLGVPRIFIPKTYALVQRILEEVLETIFFDFEEICSVRSYKSVPHKTRQILKSLLNYRLDGHPINFYQECFEATLDAIKSKVGIFQVYPVIKTKKTKKERTVLSEDGIDTGEKIVEEVEEPLHWAPRIDCLAHEDVFFSGDATWKNYFYHPCAVRKKVTVNYCRQRNFMGLEPFEHGEAVTDDTVDRIKQQRNENMGSPFGPPTLRPELNKLWIFTFYDYQENEDGELVLGSFTMGGNAPDNPTVLMRDWEELKLPYRFDPTEPVRHPILVGFAFPEPHKMYGKDFPEYTEGLQDETNMQRNQEREAVARALRVPIIVDEQAGIDIMALQIRKIGAVIKAQGGLQQGSVHELGSHNPLPLTIPSQQRTDLDYAEATSITPASLGVRQHTTESATEFAGLDRNANKRLNFIIRNLAITLFLPAMRYLARLEQEYESDEFVELVTGERLGWSFERDKNGRYVGAPPSLVIQGDFDFSVNLGMNKDQQIARLRQMAEVANIANATTLQMLQFQIANPADAKIFNTAWFVEQMAKLSGFRNTEEITFTGHLPPPQAQPNQAKGVASPPAPDRRGVAQVDFLG